MSQDVMNQMPPDAESVSMAATGLSYSEIAYDNTTYDDTEALAFPAWSIESYADSLMNELFEDVDQILEGAVRTPDPLPSPPALRSAESSSLAIQPVTVSPVHLPATLVTSQALALSQRDSALDTFLANSTATLVAPQRQATVNRFLLGFACASAILSGVLWLSNEGWLERWLVVKSVAPTQSVAMTTPVDPKVAADAKFADYLQRSLQLIEQSASQRALPASTSTTASLPTVSIPGNTAPPATAKSAPVLERIYIPVYQPPQMMSPTQLMPGVVAVPGTVSSPAGSVPPAAAPVAPVAVAPAAPVAPAHTLVGILELGKRSAAIVEVSGTAQRVYVGEGIGASGWTLVKITKQEAIVRRNGEVRSIFVGQTF